MNPLAPGYSHEVSSAKPAVGRVETKLGLLAASFWETETGTGSRPTAVRTNKVALGFVEGLNNKVRVLQRRAYGLRDEEYLRLKILTSMLPAI